MAADPSEEADFFFFLFFQNRNMVVVFDSFDTDAGSLAWQAGKKREAGLSSDLSIMRTINGNYLICAAGHTLPHHSAINCVKDSRNPGFPQVTSTGDSAGITSFGGGE
jgi:hypothetical protein